MLPFSAMASEAAPIWGDLAASAFLESSLLFKSLDPEAHDDLLHVAEQLVYAAGEVVVRQGEAGDELFLVRDGTAVVLVDAGGERREVAYLDRGAIFGEFAALGAPARTASVEARTELSVVRVPGPVVVALAARFPRVAKLLTALRTARARAPDPAP
jgi:CRP-like cAMP-binding protein